MSAVAELVARLSEAGVELWVEGEQLRARGPKHALDASTRSALADHKQQLIHLLAKRPERVPLSYAQMRLWLLNRIDDRAATYNLPIALRLTGSLNVDALEDAIADVVRRHESLRTTFPEADGVPYQHVIPSVTRDLGGGARNSPLAPGSLAPLGMTSEDELHDRLHEEASRGFDLTRDLPLRARLFRIAPDNHVLLLVLHHIAGDGWSLGVLARDLTEAYAGRSLLKLPLQYADYTLRQRARLGDEHDPNSVIAKQLAFWRDALRGIPEELALPVDRARPLAATHRGATVPLRIDRELRDAVKQLALRSNASVFMVLQAALAALLSRLGCGTDIPIGTAISGRDEESLENLIGLFLNTLVLRTDVSGLPTFRELIARVRAFDLEAYRNDRVPFQQVVEALDPARSLGRHPLFQVLLSMQNAPASELALPGLTITPEPLRWEVAKFDLMLTMDERLEGELEYSVDLFDHATAEGIAARFVRLLEAAVAQPDVPLHRVDILDREERQQLLCDFNDTDRAIPVQSIVQMFESQDPTAIAVMMGDESLMYGELNERANRVAHALISDGVRPDDLVGLTMDRSLDLIAALVGILKAGAAYVPLDAELPPLRREQFIRDAALTHVIANDHFKHPDDTNPRVALTPANLAYVNFTSGSTGTPKGVLVTHAAVMRLVHEPNFATLDKNTRMLHMAPLSFDAATLEIWGPLLNGGTVVLMPPGLPSVQEIGAAVVAQRVNTLWLTSGLFTQMVNYALPALAGVQQLLTGGDVVSVDAVERARKVTHVINGYGPTENTTFTSCYPVPRDHELRGSIPIGSPIDNTRVYVLDANLEPVPIGVAGELYVAGEGLARGYVGRAAMTAERFVANPFATGERMYRTGDLARWRADGNLDFLGRIDAQVKLRGFRIELGEIETALLAQDGIREAVVIARDQRLVAYIVATPLTRPSATLSPQAGRGLPNGAFSPPQRGEGARRADEGLRLSPQAGRGLPNGAFSPPQRGEGARRADEGLRLSPQAGRGLANGAFSPPQRGEGARRADEGLRLSLQAWRGLPNGAFSPPQRGEGARRADEGLRAALAQRLPDYMIPSAFVYLDALPLNANGKLDHAKLPAPDRQTETYRAPRTREQQLLGDLFAAVLTLDKVGVEDNFFTLGGDSIIAIQLVSRARKAGLELTPRDVFQHQTVEALSAVAKIAQARPTWSEEDAIGEVMPTPLMRSFLERSGSAGDRFNQSLLLSTPEDLDQEKLVAALQTLLDTHDALRMRLEGDRLIIAPRGSVSARERLTRITDIRQAESPSFQFGARNGRIFEAVWSPTRLLLIIHHLAVDGVSWRILHQDLVAALRGEPIDPEPIPFRVWSAAAPAAAFQAAAPAAALDPKLDTFATARHLTLDIPTALTSQLLTTVPAAFHARINDVLLTALANAFGEKSLVIDLESHGRDGAFDLSRTVGWFTRIDTVAIGGSIKQVKEQLRAMAPAQTPAQVGFNYLGRIATTREGEWSPVDEDANIENVHPSMPLFHPLDINAQVLDEPAGPRLTATWTWATRHFDEAHVRTLANRWRDALEHLASDVARGAKGHTPSDFPLVALSQHEVETLEARYPDIETILPLSSLQEGLVYHTLHDASAHDVYTVQLCVELSGPLDAARMRNAANALVARHENLRAAIVQEGLVRPVQVIAREVDVPWREVEDDGARFDLAHAPLLRFSLVRTDDDRHRLTLTNHHVLLDGWSMPILFNELLALYNGDALPPARSYADYLAWLTRQDQQSAIETWRAYLSGLEEPTRLERRALSPSTHPDGLRARRSREVELSSELTALLQRLTRREGLTQNTLLQGLWAVLLARLTGRDDIVFGVTVSGRPPELAGVEVMLGLFINTLPLRAQLAPGKRLSTLLHEIQNDQTRLMPVQFAGLADIQRAAGIGQLFDTLVVFENYPLDAAEARGELQIVAADGRDATHYPLSLAGIPGDRMRLRFDYQRSQFSREEIESLAARFIGFLEQATHDPLLHELHFPDLERPALSPSDVLDGLRARRSRLDSDDTLTELFERQVAQRPDAIALVDGETALTYRALNERANRLAHALLAYGARTGDLIGIALERSADMIVAVLATVKAGAAYLPLDPEYPAARIAAMIDDASPAILLTTREFRACLPQSARVLLIDEEHDAPAHDPTDPDRTAPLLPQHPAYVIYTSGSTGPAKGVVVTHRSVVRLVVDTNYLQLDTHDRVAQGSNASFDAAVFEVWGALLHGARLVIMRREALLDPHALDRAIHDAGITVLFLTTQLFNQVALEMPSAFSALRCLLTGGENADPERFRDVLRAAPPQRLLHMYGPSETTTYATFFPVDAIADDATHVPIGGPIANARTYVLDSSLHPVPIGVAGELYVAGSGVAQGYLERPALSAERFVADPFANGERMYRTGDLTRRLENNTLEFLGRADRQIKLRGFRIEPGEIEAALTSHEDVAQAAVMLRGKQLVAYVVASPHPAFGHPRPASGTRATHGDLLPSARGEGARRADEGSLRNALRDRLPDYMIPSTFVFIDSLPLTPNGKIDWRALPVPVEQRREVRRPSSDLERVIADVWRDVLGVDAIGTDDNFFDLGGHSLLLARVLAQLRTRLSAELTIVDLFRYPSVGALAARLQPAREKKQDAHDRIKAQKEATQRRARAAARPRSQR
ncbi:MAG TPA: amino acid adenylation domain-containing protein [Thermoanaerobaculia bacterium]|nr:amino acid adenylation domain-containing protein [Thermoanaerobaculia bacterium]